MKLRTKKKILAMVYLATVYLLTLYALWIGQILEFLIALFLIGGTRIGIIILPNVVEKFLEIKDEKEGK